MFCGWMFDDDRGGGGVGGRRRLDVIGLSDLSFSFPDCCCESRSGSFSLNNDSAKGCLSPMVTLDGAGEARGSGNILYL